MWFSKGEKMIKHIISSEPNLKYHYMKVRHNLIIHKYFVYKRHDRYEQQNITGFVLMICKTNQWQNMIIKAKCTSNLWLIKLLHLYILPKSLGHVSHAIHSIHKGRGSTTLLMKVSFFSQIPVHYCITLASDLFIGREHR